MTINSHEEHNHENQHNKNGESSNRNFNKHDKPFNSNGDRRNENNHHNKNGESSKRNFNKHDKPFNKNRRSRDAEVGSPKGDEDDWSDETTSTAPPSGEFRAARPRQNKQHSQVNSPTVNQQKHQSTSPIQDPVEMAYPPPLIPVNSSNEEDLNISSVSTEILKTDEPEVDNNSILLLINLPRDATFMNIVHLMEEFNPIHISFIKTIYLKNDNFKYCKVFLGSSRDAKLASTKLDGSKLKENKILAKVLNDAFSLFKINN